MEAAGARAVVYHCSRERFEVPALDLPSFVLEHAERLADRPALVDGGSGEQLGYGELATRVKGMAAGLAQRGFGRGDVLALNMPNSPEYAVAFHGTNAAGGTCTTANPLYTPHELAHQLTDAGARLLVTVPEFLDSALEAGRRAGVEEVFVVGDADGATPFAELRGDPKQAPEPRLDLDADLAVLPYSSGTTGLPKGVMLSHRNLVTNLCQLQASVPIAADDRVLGVLPFFHIYGMSVIMNQGLRAGATIVTMARFELERFLDLIERHAITRAYVVPPIALALADHPELAARDLSSLELIQCGGAPLGIDVGRRLAERTGCQVLEGYGLTEASPVTHATRPDGRAKLGSIGEPLPGTDCRLVDPQTGVDADLGDPGELWIRGPQIMRGYLNNPDATAITVGEDGWLHTGDIATIDGDGFFRIVDRLTELIKYNGFQVAPAELEALIITHELVSDVAVVGIPDAHVGEIPKAFVVAADDAFDSKALLSWVADHVAPQKRIRAVERVESIPKSASGKILRRQLVGRA